MANTKSKHHGNVDFLISKFCKGRFVSKKFVCSDLLIIDLTSGKSFYTQKF